MRTEELSLVSRADKMPLSALIARPEGAPRGLVQIAHGMAEYKERYLPFVRFLTEAGYACVINDHRGHGSSVYEPRDLGWFGEVGARGVVDDMRQCCLLLTERFPGLPLCLFGHSMGSLAARAFARQYDHLLSALVVCGCPSENPAARLGRALVRAMRGVRGERYRSKLIDNMVNGAFCKKFPEEKSLFCWINSDPKAVAEYEKDELCGFLFTLNGYEALLDLMLSCYERKGWRVDKANLPVLFISGGDDPCMISREKLDQAAKRMREIGYADVSVRTFTGMRHEILQEPQREIVFREVLRFLEEKMTGRAAP